MTPEPSAVSGAYFVNAALERLQYEYPKAVVSGDWAARLHLGTPAAYRLELILAAEDLDSLTAEYGATRPGEAQGRQALLFDGVEVTLLAAEQALVGERLQLPASALAEYAEVASGTRRLSAEGVFASRMASLLDRPDSKAADRDRRDLLALANRRGGLDWDGLASILQQTDHSAGEQHQLLRETFGRMAELESLGRHRTTWLGGWQRQAFDAVDRAEGAAAATAKLEELGAKRDEGTQTLEERRLERILYYREIASQQTQDHAPDFLDPLPPSPDLDLEREP